MICFNRNIVECKFADFCKKGSAVASFNRNIVECKLDQEGLTEYGEPLVLIETLWNVNYLKGKGLIEPDFVLIETLWNVNWTLSGDFNA